MAKSDVAGPLPSPSEAAAGECELLGDAFDYYVQIGLAASAAGTLWYKRHVELPKRPLLVWSFDASKQAYAGALQHVVNLYLGVAFASGGGASECAWYLVSFTFSIQCSTALPTRVRSPQL